MLPSHILVFTGLESTLIDSRTDSFAGAETALGEIDRRKIPLILCTGKTRAQLDNVRRKLGHSHPFISENGGGIFIPDGYFNLKIPGLERRSRFLCLPIAKPHSEALTALQDISAVTGVSVVSFHEMTAREIAQNAGLSTRDAEAAKQRDFDEPFFFAGASESAIGTFREEAARRKANLYQAGRFWRISQGADLGRAVNSLVKLYREATPRTRLSSIGLGSLATDVPLLKAVDQAILLRPNADRADANSGRHPTLETPSDRSLRQLKISHGEASGPVAWERAILTLLQGAQR